MIVFEPLGELLGVWREVDAVTALIVQFGVDEEVVFVPRAF